MSGHWRPPRQPLISTVIPGVARSRAQVPEGARAPSIPCLDGGQLELLRARPLHTQWGCHGGPPQPHRRPGKQGGKHACPLHPLPHQMGITPPYPGPIRPLLLPLTRNWSAMWPEGRWGHFLPEAQERCKRVSTRLYLLFLRPPSHQGGLNPTNSSCPQDTRGISWPGATNWSPVG